MAGHEGTIRAAEAPRAWRRSHHYTAADAPHEAHPPAKGVWPYRLAARRALLPCYWPALGTGESSSSTSCHVRAGPRSQMCR